MLKIDNLYVSYGNIEALKGVSIEVRESESVAIIGANGAGKSTLLKTIMGFEKAKKGKIIFDNQEIGSLPTHKRSKMGISFVPEGARVFGQINVLGNLMLGVYKEKDKKIIQQRLDYVYSIFPNLKDRKNQLAGTLSGGERQMLAMARALMSNPKLLMIDEISLGLMPKLVDTVFEVVDKLRKSGITILLAEQNAHMAIDVSDRIYILTLGRVTKQTNKDDIENDEEIKRAYLGR